jgi:hypothetical protein
VIGDEERYSSLIGKPCQEVELEKTDPSRPNPRAAFCFWPVGQFQKSKSPTQVAWGLCLPDFG